MAPQLWRKTGGEPILNYPTFSFGQLSTIVTQPATCLGITRCLTDSCRHCETHAKNLYTTYATKPDLSVSPSTSTAKRRNTGFHLPEEENADIFANPQMRPVSHSVKGDSHGCRHLCTRPSSSVYSSQVPNVASIVASTDRLWPSGPWFDNTFRPAGDGVWTGWVVEAPPPAVGNVTTAIPKTFLCADMGIRRTV